MRAFVISVTYVPGSILVYLSERKGGVNTGNNLVLGCIIEDSKVLPDDTRGGIKKAEIQSPPWGPEAQVWVHEERVGDGPSHKGYIHICNMVDIA